MQIITGNKFKKICDFIFDENGFIKTEINNKIPIFFIKTDFIDIFFNGFKPKNYYKIITHNSDYSINENHLHYLNDPKLVGWFGQNINTTHPKLHSIPIGIANEIWDHGDESKLIETILKNNQKNKIIHCSFDINTNYNERNQCVISMNKNNLKMNERENFENYLNSLSKSFFTLSPNGNGIDCHKLWESLYLKTIPIVTESINIDFYKDLPIYVIKSWSHFDINQLNENLYNEIIKKHDYNLIDMGYYQNKILKFN